MNAVEQRALTSLFSAASRVPPAIDPEITPSTRAWQVELSSDRGTRFRIAGAQTVGGRIDVIFNTGEGFTSIKAGDYIYPSDVRFDAHAGRLYVRADGTRAWPQRSETWLFELDVDGRHERASTKLDPASLPGLCAMPRGAG